jgi:hypothetical protein
VQGVLNSKIHSSEKRVELPFVCVCWGRGGGNKRKGKTKKKTKKITKNLSTNVYPR